VKKMTEPEAWEYIRQCFADKNLEYSWNNTVYLKLPDGYGSRGMCDILAILRSNYKITAVTYKKMTLRIKDSFKKKFSDPEYHYLFPMTKYGARKRREFCSKVIEELRLQALDKQS